MANKEPTRQEVEIALHCLQVLRAVQKDSRTSGWYRGEVRGKEAIGVATASLVRKGLIQPAAGPQPFRLTKKGKEFIAIQIKEWETFVAKLNHPGALEKFTRALGRVSEDNK
jgi:predicted transcriptional regulator